MNKKILGLDLGTNSIGWALIEHDFDKKEGTIKGLGSRIIPMSQDILGKFDSGVSISQTAERTGYRGVRRLIQRNLLRRERLLRVLNLLGFLPKHYAKTIDFEKHLGQFKGQTETKLNYRKNEEGKHKFIFMDSFNEMASEFKKVQPLLFYNKANGEETKIPLDWTIYYLRKKALTKKISKEELAWILLNFNQKRGYYQLRGEEEESNSGKLKEFYALKVDKIEATEDKNAKGTWYNVVLENGWIYRRQSKESLENWIGKIKEFIVTTSIDEENNPKLDKEGNIKRSFSAVDSEKDWIAIKKKTEQDIDQSNKTVGEYIYASLLTDPKQKIRGKLIKTIERENYKKELKTILKTQISFHPELKNKALYNSCIEELYPRNEAHINNIKEEDFSYLFIDDIIFYQRPLKSKKSTISDCPYETKTFIKKGEKETIGIKCISKSNPLYQEFRLWQFVQNLKIYKKTEKEDIDVSTQLFTSVNDWVDLFDFCNTKSEIEQKHILSFLESKKHFTKAEKVNYRWNYPEDKKYPGNQTRVQLLNRLKKVTNVDANAFLTKEMEHKLWHIIYSVSDKQEFEQAIKNFASRNNLDKESFEKNFLKIPPYKNEYGAYSEKAIKQLLTLMRIGKYWDKNAINIEVKERITSVITRLETIDYEKERISEVADDDVPIRLLKSFLPFKNQNPLQALNTYQACYAVYERHAEIGDILHWKTPKDIDVFLNNFKQHSLRNPIVEQVVTETLRVVRDIWKQYGKNKENFFSEIHVELGREMKNSSDKRKKISDRNQENENTNQRIKSILEELKNESSNDIRPYSPSHQEILKIYEDGIYLNPEADFSKLKEEDVKKIRKNNSPNKAEINKYKLWLEQGYTSPYTGEIIPLHKLFTTAYQIEHIIPQSRYFDNSLNNKVICESAVNEEKGNKTAYEYLKNNGGSIVELSQGKNTLLLTLENYEKHCNTYFKKNRTKLKNLLSEDIPEGFINRQLNDSRYISKLVKGLLSNVVRENGEKEATSKKLVPVTGAITSKLKQDWGLNDKWNEIISPRFKRLNDLTNSNDFGYEAKQLINGKETGKTFFRTQVPDEISRGFNKKRIDHRHHALDALVIACCTKDHSNYLNALNAEKNNFSLRNKLLIKNKNEHYTKHFQLPWTNFSNDVKDKLEHTIISFKQNLRVINKTNNKTWQWRKNDDGNLKKILVKQEKGQNWAIRKPMHKETVSGKVAVKQLKKGESSLINYLNNWELIADKDVKNKVKSLAVVFDKDLKTIKKNLKSNPIIIAGKKIEKIKVYEWSKNATATRIQLTEKFTRKQLEAVTDSGIRIILENHLKNYVDDNNKERFDLAFNTDGIEELNKNIESLNNRKKHQPIHKVRVYEEGTKFSIGETGQKSKKFVEAAQGTNLFFAIYWNEEQKKRVYETIPLNKVIAHQKWRANLNKEELKKEPLIPINHEKGKFLFDLSPNDLVYIPTEEELNNPNLVNLKNLNPTQINRIYKMVSSSSSECFFIKNTISSLIKKYDSKSKLGELGSLNKLETTICINQIRIKESCWKLKIDRLGNITNCIR